MPNRPLPPLSHTWDCRRCLLRTYKQSWHKVLEGQHLTRLYLRVATLELRTSQLGPMEMVCLAHLAQEILLAVFREVPEVEDLQEVEVAMEAVEAVHLDLVAVFQTLDQDFLKAGSILRKYRRLQQLYASLSSPRR